MPKIIEYQIVSTKNGLQDGPENSDGVDRLATAVNLMIEEGYQPFGGVAVRVGSARGAYFVQAMVKYDA